MKTTRNVAILAALSPFLLGMGSGDVSSTGETPKASKNYNVTVVDETGAKTEASNFTSEGKIYFEGKKGATTVSVSFDKVRDVAVEKKTDAKGGVALITAALADGGSVSFEMKCSDKFSGNTGFGSFSIEACNARKVTFR